MKNSEKEILRFLEAPHSMKELKEFIEDKEGDKVLAAQTLSKLHKDGFIRVNAEKMYLLSTDGERRLCKLRTDNSWVDKKQIVPIIISVILSLIAIWFSYSSLQAQIASITPNYPVIEITVDKAQQMLRASTLTIENFSGESVPLKVINRGGVETQPMNIDLISPGYLQSSGGYTKTVEGGHTGEVSLIIRQASCFRNWKECNKSALPSGIVPITFFVTCENCRERRFNKTIEFCIWHNGTDECTT